MILVSGTKQNKAEERDVTGGEGDQALVESGLHDWIPQDDDSEDVTHHTQQADAGNEH